VSDDHGVLRVVRPQALVPQLAAESLRDAILSGRLGPGQRLIEATLAKSLGISRPSLREAISQLGAEKLVTITPNRGAAVAVVNWDEAAEIYDVRALLEGEAGYRFAKLAAKPDIEKMHRALRKFARASEKNDLRKLVSSTGEFYEVLLHGCGNTIIHDLLRGLNARIALLRATSMSRVGRRGESLAEMTAILAAVEQADPDAARVRCIFHVRQAAEAAQSYFRNAEAVEDAG
jgi:GntR family transcriptional regulator, trigonelline degradation regulator